MKRRTACILITAAKGHRRAARGLVGKAIRSALSIDCWKTAPFFVEYVGKTQTDGSYARFLLHVSDHDLEAI